MNSCKSSNDWNERKKFFQQKKLHFLISVKESYERKLAAISASISKLVRLQITSTYFANCCTLKRAKRVTKDAHIGAITLEPLEKLNH